MDINAFRALATVLAVIAFAGVCWWAYGPSRKSRFEEDGNLPFQDDQENESTLKQNGHGVMNNE